MQKPKVIKHGMLRVEAEPINHAHATCRGRTALELDALLGLVTLDAA
ncbi:hypothetical protein [Modicisalibacter luteus]